MTPRLPPLVLTAEDRSRLASWWTQWLNSHETDPGVTHRAFFPEDEPEDRS